MSLRQLLPVLDIIGNANKHIARVGKFLQKYGDLDLFPVKLQVPLALSLQAPMLACGVSAHGIRCARRGGGEKGPYLFFFYCYIFKSHKK